MSLFLLTKFFGLHKETEIGGEVLIFEETEEFSEALDKEVLVQKD